MIGSMLDISDFVVPDWSAPLDVEARLAAVPAEAKVKGLFFRTALREAEGRTGSAPGRGSYSPLSDYPVKELIEVLVECAKLAHPDVGRREGLRRLGKLIFPALRENAAGRFLFSVAGGDLVAAVKLIGRAYAMLSTARAKLVEAHPDHAVIELRNSWTFPDSYHAGVLEGALEAFHRNGQVRLRNVKMCDVDVLLSWT